jgi:hypothetical protein
MYDTSNTRLAAALKTLGFKLVYWDQDTDKQTVFHYEDDVLFGKTAGQYNHIWREKEWHDFNTHHPFRHIVKAAEARDWIINRVIHDEYQDTGGESEDSYYVYDINIATCIIADGYYLLRFTERRFYFVSGAEAIHKMYATPEHGTPLWWQCGYLKHLRMLMGLVPRDKIKLDKLYASA